MFYPIQRALIYGSTTLMALFALPVANGAVIASYDASNSNPDPASQGWDLTKGTNPENFAQAATLNGVPVWQISTSNTGEGKNYFSYLTSLTSQQDSDLATTGWSLTANVAVEESKSSTTYATTLVFFTDFSPDGAEIAGNDRWIYNVRFGADNGKLQIRLGIAGGSSDILWTAANTDLVNVELRFNPSADSAELFANGVSIATDYQGFLFANTWTRGVAWGKTNDDSNSRVASWGSVEFAAIPEPSSLTLLFLAGTALTFLRGGRPAL